MAMADRLLLALFSRADSRGPATSAGAGSPLGAWVGVDSAELLASSTRRAGVVAAAAAVVGGVAVVVVAGSRSGHKQKTTQVDEILLFILLYCVPVPIH
jgi:hypothetical protein